MAETIKLTEADTLAALAQSPQDLTKPFGWRWRRIIVCSRLWLRGHASVTVNITDAGRSALAKHREARHAD